MSADGSLLRLTLVNRVFGATAFLFDGEDAKSGNRFERIIGFGMEKPDPKVSEIRGIDQQGDQEKREKNAFNERAQCGQAEKNLSASITDNE
ncbi:MAG TPA: hypothetical protein VJO16_02270 [Candidatus Acidoferrum sp.]|nr:hypothetical protein [Candidatus Acidoferrum sp.]